MAPTFKNGKRQNRGRMGWNRPFVAAGPLTVAAAEQRQNQKSARQNLFQNERRRPLNTTRSGTRTPLDQRRRLGPDGQRHCYKSPFSSSLVGSVSPRLATRGLHLGAAALPPPWRLPWAACAARTQTLWRTPAATRRRALLRARCTFLHQLACKPKMPG